MPQMHYIKAVICKHLLCTFREGCVNRKKKEMCQTCTPHEYVLICGFCIAMILLLIRFCNMFHKQAWCVLQSKHTYIHGSNHLEMDFLTIFAIWICQHVSEYPTKKMFHIFINKNFFFKNNSHTWFNFKWSKLWTELFFFSGPWANTHLRVHIIMQD